MAGPQDIVSQAGKLQGTAHIGSMQYLPVRRTCGLDYE